MTTSTSGTQIITTHAEVHQEPLGRGNKGNQQNTKHGMEGTSRVQHSTNNRAFERSNDISQVRDVATGLPSPIMIQQVPNTGHVNSHPHTRNGEASGQASALVLGHSQLQQPIVPTLNYSLGQNSPLLSRTEIQPRFTPDKGS